MASRNRMAIGSERIASGNAAWLARPFSVNSAVSETPVRSADSEWRSVTGLNLPAQDFVQRPQVAGGGRGLVAAIAHRPSDRGGQRRRPGHLPVDDAVAAGELLLRSGPDRQAGQFVENGGV